MISSRTDNWMPLYVGDYLRDTMHLSTEHHGAYALLLMAGWTRGGLLPDDDVQLAAIVRLPLRRWQTIRPVIQGFFSIAGGHWTQKRLTAEVERAQRLSKVRQEAGKKGGRPKAIAEPIGLAKAEPKPKQTETPLPLPIPKKEEDPVADATEAQPPPASPIDLRGETMRSGKAFLIDRGVKPEQAGALIGKWRKDFGNAAVIDALAAAQAEDPSGNIIEFLVGCLRRRGNGRSDHAAKETSVEQTNRRREGLARAFMDRSVVADRPGAGEYGDLGSGVGGG